MSNQWLAAEFEAERDAEDAAKAQADAASKRGRRSRAKGRVWERAVAKLLRAIWPDAKRGFQSRSGRDASDVEGTPFHIECKHGKQVNLRAALRQAVADSDGRPPVVIARDDRQEPVVVMRLEDWLTRERELLARIDELAGELAQAEMAVGSVPWPEGGE